MCICIHDIVCTSNAIMHAGYVVYLCMAVHTILTLQGILCHEVLSDFVDTFEMHTNLTKSIMYTIKSLA